MNKLRQLKQKLSKGAIFASLAIAAFPSLGQGNQDIHSTCAKSPQQCLEVIGQYLTSEKTESRIWFQYKMYQIDALFQLVKFEQLANEVSPWVERKDIPLKFKISVLIYYAKILSSQGSDAIAANYMNQALDAINDVNSVAFDPLLVVQVANGLNHIGEYQKGYDLLIPLEKKYRNRPMAKFKHELYENLGHFALRLKQFQEHLGYRLQALEWAKEVGNDNQTAISLYNVARAHQILEDYERAFHYFELAEQLNAMGPSDQNMINYRRAEMSLVMNDLVNAQGYFDRVNRNTEFESYIDMFDALEQKLLQAKTK
ncbi:tetratricopeptide repeat protein [Thalassotalea sp. M1531]|uniref:Tetratricopeptide repeat protein n=1 Tax=Thalassotalea algicola TaxID=2716224 RepID=A0A7Y0LBC6_9GAMM|nr:tetratricopeptide repeat protein [Thalassotalea algicola]NMP31073.1 tetratricopeptide repeat protein [Thalassotalea algicola]